MLTGEIRSARAGWMRNASLFRIVPLRFGQPGRNPPGRLAYVPSAVSRRPSLWI
ncbi:hypothetical protein GCM10023174_19290 [Chelativorans composti]